MARVNGSRALVLGGGGVAGIAWLLGIVRGLQDQDVDLTSADTLIGTSAGACVAAQLGTGALADAVALQRSPVSAEIEVDFDIDRYSRAAAQASDSDDDQLAARRLANLEPVVPTAVDPERRRQAVAARLPVKHWPRRALLVSAVAQRDGRRVAFSADSGVGLVDAVTASCAVPGVWPPVEIDGRRYVDGGAHSPTNVDLAGGHQTVVVLVPMALGDQAQAKLAREREQLGPAATHVIVVDDASQEAIGPNPLSPHTREAALEAGVRQASEEADALADLWD